jgi:uncharacterized protein YqgC (DUF456 family)
MDTTLFLEIVLIVLTGLVMFVGLIGAVVPVLPGAWLIWLAAVGYGLSQPAFGQPLFDGWIGGVAMVILTLLALADLGLEYVVTSSVAAKEGVSFQAILASIALGLLGLPFFPPIGPLVGAVVGLFLVEYFRHGRDLRRAWQGVMSYARGKGWSIAAEVLLCLIMIGVWLAWVAADLWI